MSSKEDADYGCTLDAASVKKAKDELNENPEDRLAAVQAFRDWVKAQPHITWPALDTHTMLHYLRGAKFSQIRAREMLEAVLLMRIDLPHWFRNIDISEKKFQMIVDSGYQLPLPKRDGEKRTILIQRIGQLDPYHKNYSRDDVMRVGMLMGMYITRSELTQVHGCVFVIDFTGFTAKHMSGMMSNSDVQKWHKKWQKKVPGRFKKIILYNAGAFVETLMAFMKPFMAKKLQDRIVVCETAEALYRHVPKELLPDEYLPDDYKGPSAGQITDIVANFKKELEQMKDWIEWRSGNKFNIDESKRPKDTDVPTEHFRKLNVD